MVKKKPEKTGFLVGIPILRNREVHILSCTTLAIINLETRLIKHLEKCGLNRIQKSVFGGVCRETKKELLYSGVADFTPVLEDDDGILVIPLREETLKQIFIVGSYVDLENLFRLGGVRFI